MATVTLTVLSLIAVLKAIEIWANYDLIGNMIPQYAKWVYTGAAALGAWTLYTMYGKKG